MQVTTFVPPGKAVPEGGKAVICAAGCPTAGGKVATTLAWPTKPVTLMLGGQVTYRQGCGAAAGSSSKAPMSTTADASELPSNSRTRPSKSVASRLSLVPASIQGDVATGCQSPLFSQAKRGLLVILQAPPVKLVASSAYGAPDKEKKSLFRMVGRFVSPVLPTFRAGVPTTMLFMMSELVSKPSAKIPELV